MAAQESLEHIKRRHAQKMTAGLKTVAIYLFVVSGVINLLALTGSIYMLQVYDRVLGSGSLPTLITLSVMAIGLYFFQGVFDVLRSQILVRVGGGLIARSRPWPIAPSSICRALAIRPPRRSSAAATLTPCAVSWAAKDLWRCSIFRGCLCS